MCLHLLEFYLWWPSSRSLLGAMMMKQYPKGFTLVSCQYYTFLILWKLNFSIINISKCVELKWSFNYKNDIKWSFRFPRLGFQWSFPKLSEVNLSSSSRINCTPAQALKGQQPTYAANLCNLFCRHPTNIWFYFKFNFFFALLTCGFALTLYFLYALFFKNDTSHESDPNWLYSIHHSVHSWNKCSDRSRGV